MNNEKDNMDIGGNENIMPLSESDESLVEKMANYSIIGDDDLDADDLSDNKAEADINVDSNAVSKSISVNFNTRNNASYLGKSVSSPDSDPTIRSTFISSKRTADNFVAASKPAPEKKFKSIKKILGIVISLVIIAALIGVSYYCIRRFDLINVIKNLF